MLLQRCPSEFEQGMPGLQRSQAIQASSLTGGYSITNWILHVSFYVAMLNHKL